MADITTIKLKQETKARLLRLKEHDRETFEEVIRKILFILNRVRKDPISANRLLTRIDKNIKRKSQYTSIEKEKNTIKNKINQKNQINERPKTESSTQ
tara:strand:- start:4740 stop:5033 length:294 start_codon:yes stop_codon:yes gene_type:complete